MTRGLDESLESRDAGEAYTEEPTDKHCGKRKRKTS